MPPKQQSQINASYTPAPHRLHAATSLPITPLQRAAAKALRTREEAQRQNFPSYLDPRASASASASASPLPLPTVDWGTADNKSKGERGGEKKGGVYEGWHLTYEPLRRPSLGLAVWSCVQEDWREGKRNINDHFPSKALGSRWRCGACGHPVAGREWKEAGGIGNG